MMVMRGDTIVYNADAFELAEGSMLDQLIARLPGVKLSRGGAITINGNPVSSLLIDGKDFFKGDATMALENLPAYMVSKIKSYQKIPDNAYITRKDMKPRSDDPWVIDVNLKKEYHTGWFANAEAGGGTDKKYLGRIFGVRFSDRSRVSVYGEINNVNSNQRPGKEGNWENEEAMVGENKLIKGGLYAALYGEEDLYKIITTFNASHTKSLDETQSASTNFYNSGNTFARANSVNCNKDFSFDWEGDLAYRAKFAYITLEQTLYHNSYKLNDFNRSQTSTQPFANYLEESVSTYQDLINSYTDYGRDHLKSWIYTGSLTMSIKMPHQKELSINVFGTYKHQDQNDQSIYNLHTPQISQQPDYRNRYGIFAQKSYNILTSAGYAIFTRDRNHLYQSLYANYTFKYEKNRGGRDYYRLDHLGGEWAIPQHRTLGWLPSTQDSLAICTDWQNTYFTVDSKATHTPELRYIMMGKNNFQLMVILPLNFERKHINDLRMQTLRNDFVKHYTLFCPSIDLSYRGFQLYGSLTRTSPLMTRMLDVEDNSNPLFITKGNGALKPEDKYTTFLRYSMEETKHAQTLQAKIEYSTLRNAIGDMRYYDVQSGVTTSTPQNINGNWQVNFSGNYARSLDKKQKWTLDLNCGVQYLNSVDFQQTSLMQQDAKSVVKNLFTQGALTLAYHCKLFNASLKGMLDWQHGTSERTDFVTINSLNQLYTLTNQWSLPWNINIDTDLTCFLRSGYADASMNSNEWIWNMAISKRMLKDKSLAIKVSAHDILAQRSSIQRVLNAQGRTETWHNVVPRYFMLSLIYRLHKAPKKNN